jgi:hypothetical protein
MIHYIDALNALIGYGAKGDTAAAADNGLGAHFHLTDERMGTHQYRAFVVAPGSLKVLEGIWSYDENDILIEWSIGKTIRYPHSVWRLNTPVLKKIYNRETGQA